MKRKKEKDRIRQIKMKMKIKIEMENKIEAVIQIKTTTKHVHSLFSTSESLPDHPPLRTEGAWYRV